MSKNVIYTVLVVLVIGLLGYGLLNGPYDSENLIGAPGGKGGGKKEKPVEEGPVCGNSVVETGEQCDDGNTASGDGCSDTCQPETSTTPIDFDKTLEDLLRLNYEIRTKGSEDLVLLRKQMMLELAEEDPNLFLAASLSGTDRNSLSLSNKSNVEKSTSKRGTLEVEIIEGSVRGMANDSSGSGSNGVIENANYVAGVDGTALQFNGVFSTGVKLNNFELSPSAGTISAWVKLYEGNNPGIIFWSGEQNGDGFGAHQEIHLTATHEDSFEFFLEGGLNDCRAQSAGSVSVGEWHHVVGTYSGIGRKNVNCELYVDGVFQKSDKGGSHDATAWGMESWIGRPGNGGITERFLNGDIDEVRVYDRALRASEISELTAGSVNNSGLMGYWEFEESEIDPSIDYVLNTGTQKFTLTSPDGNVTSAISGAIVDVDGIELGKYIVTSGEVSSTIKTLNEPSSTENLGALKVAFLIFQEEGVGLLFNNPIDYEADMARVVDYYEEVSYGQTTIDWGDIYGPFVYSTEEANGINERDEMLAFADANGVDLTQYSSIMFYHSGYSTARGSLGRISLDASNGPAKIGTVIMDRNALGTELMFNRYGSIVHELGHNMGNAHANFFDCGQAHTIGLISECTSLPYTDRYDVMGDSRVNIGPFNAIHKEQTGWLNGRIENVSSDGTYSLDYYDGLNDILALKIPRTFDGFGNPNSYYYAEHRTPIGRDSFVSSIQDELGPQIRIDGILRTGDTHLLDMTRDSGFGSDPEADGIVAGDTFLDPNTGLSVKTVSVDANSAQLTIKMGGSECTGKTPAFSLSPLTTQVEVPPTGPILTEISFELTNLDTGNCFFKVLYLDSFVTVLGGEFSFASEEITITPTSPGETINGTIFIENRDRVLGKVTLPVSIFESVPGTDPLATSKNIIIEYCDGICETPIIVENLIENGDLELWSNGTDLNALPDGSWSHDSGSETTLYADSSSRFGGVYSLYKELHLGTIIFDRSFLWTSVPVEPDKNYEVSGMIKYSIRDEVASWSTRETEFTGLAVESDFASAPTEASSSLCYQIINPDTDTDQWTEFSCTFNSGKATKVEVFTSLVIDTSGNCLEPDDCYFASMNLDNFSLTEI